MDFNHPSGSLWQRSHVQPYLLPRDSSGCVTCDGPSPTCNCTAGQSCVLTGRTCNQCPTIQCNDNSSSSSSSGVNAGVIAGPVVAVLLIASLGLFWWLRKKKRRDLSRLEDLAARARKAESAGFHLSQPNSPQPPSARSLSNKSGSVQLPIPPVSATTRRSSQRSPLPAAPVNAEYYDENGSVVRVYGGNRGFIDLRSNDPFADRQDRQSISTTNTGTTNQSTHIIPIQYIPPSKSDEALANKPLQRSTSAATRTLQAARQNLQNGAPRRPVRSPDLDLRLSSERAGRSGEDDPSPSSPPYSAGVRSSYLSDNSAAPSFLSGTTDLHVDAPRIYTSKQVHLGRIHQAEVVHLNKSQALMDVLARKAQGVSTITENPFAGQPTGQSTAFDMSTPNTVLPGNTRTLTPLSLSRRVGDEEALADAYEGEPHSAGSTDLRFSMGSLARDSVSSMGTLRYLANAGGNAVPPPRSFSNGEAGPRESMMSGKSNADSFLGGFPMIPPGAAGRDHPPLPPGQGLPQSTSVSTLDHHATISRPPPAFRHPSVGGSKSRPTTADSFLGSFPFVPPNMDDLAELPSAALPSAAVPDTGAAAGDDKARQDTAEEGTRSQGRNTLGMSTTSEGLGGFDFSFEGAPPMPKR